MKYLFLAFLLSISSVIAFAQDAASLYETGKKFLKQGDYDNAILVLKRATSLAPEVMLYQKDLANAYFYKGDIDNASTSLEKLIDADEADEELFLLACNISRTKNDLKAAEKYLKKGIKKFERSGALYNIYGEVLGLKSETSAIAQWEKGIEKDPNFAGNYYNAAKYYFYTNNINAKIWSIYYGEIFVNQESYTPRTVEIKNIILDSYKKIFTDENFGKKNTKNEFEKIFIENIENQKETILSGVTTPNLIMLRTRFILSWNAIKSSFMSSLFDKQQQLLKEGMFEDYNYWLFETIQDINAFENWIKLHAASFDQFSKYHQNRVFKVTEKEYYKTKN